MLPKQSLGGNNVKLAADHWVFFKKNKDFHTIQHHNYSFPDLKAMLTGYAGCSRLDKPTVATF